MHRNDQSSSFSWVNNSESRNFHYYDRLLLHQIRFQQILLTLFRSPHSLPFLPYTSFPSCSPHSPSPLFPLLPTLPSRTLPVSILSSFPFPSFPSSSLHISFSLYDIRFLLYDFRFPLCHIRFSVYHSRFSLCHIRSFLLHIRFSLYDTRFPLYHVGLRHTNRTTTLIMPHQNKAYVEKPSISFVFFVIRLYIIWHKLLITTIFSLHYSTLFYLCNMPVFVLDLIVVFLLFFNYSASLLVCLSLLLYFYRHYSLSFNTFPRQHHESLLC